ncbi:MAG TPA: hydrogenase subunit MbhD domain-containing protein [Halanaerobiales bacterium]|nr:hydrogenase subunit MbhD domain-containing protein [Halanaerobiales bacterium]
MIILKYLLLIFLIAAAYLAITFKEELISIIFLSIFSITLTTLYLIHNAPDVALAEAVIGAGLNTAIFMTVISQVREGKSIFREDD